MTFGAEIPSGRFSFPTSPTWMTYAGDDSKCMDNIPVLIRPETFCKAFLAEARVFRYRLYRRQPSCLFRDLLSVRLLGFRV